ncbi:MAG: bacillithiol biosynthesis cysteine-adding enzyme BshC [Bacteroidia bacterium]|nr:bacillithiol biosynthesis cysteine-adding enzyme BshC [Bacteroidia bacterium]
MTKSIPTHRHIKDDYLSGHDPLKPFYSYAPVDPPFGQIISDKKFSLEKRKRLHQALSEQYEGYELPALLSKNLDLLLDENTYTVTTGHQLGLMGGPLFTVYKVLSTIVLTEKLKQSYPDYNFVPVFWIHTEDHDFEEINHYYKDFGEKLTYHGKFASATGWHILDKSIEGLIPGNFTAELRQAWQEGKSLANAYRTFYHELMGAYGLVILDASHPSLKISFKDVLKREIFEQMAFKAVGRTSEELEKAGYKLQIHPREINLFYLDEFGRNRLDFVNGKYVALDRDLSWTVEEMEGLIENHPERFSPNVSLRPLYQEIILPNLAYFGGWGELSYWVQLKGVFEAAGENFPLLLPRFSATLFPEELARDWTELGLKIEDVRKTQAVLNKEVSQTLWDDAELLAMSEEVSTAIKRLEEYIKKNLSDTLSHSAQALGVKSGNFMANLHKKANKVVRNDHPKIFEKIIEIKSLVNPDRLVQERIWSLASTGMKAQAFVRWIKEHCDPLSLEHKVLLMPAVNESGIKST